MFGIGLGTLLSTHVHLLNDSLVSWMSYTLHLILSFWLGKKKSGFTMLLWVTKWNPKYPSGTSPWVYFWNWEKRLDSGHLAHNGAREKTAGKCFLHAPLRMPHYIRNLWLPTLRYSRWCFFNILFPQLYSNQFNTHIYNTIMVSVTTWAIYLVNFNIFLMDSFAVYDPWRN